jgi:hypothetical protein
MEKEVILALVLAALFLGAIAWLVIYSRLQHRTAGRQERQALPAESAVEESDIRRRVVAGRVTGR